MTIRVVTLNVWALPFGISRFNGARMRLIGDSLPKLDADVFAFQEVWTREAHTELVAAGQRAGYPHVWHRETLLKGSGLLVLSRVPILETSFHPFTVTGLPQRLHHGDWWSGKGIALLRLAHPDGEVMIMNTHLLARYVPATEPDEYLAMRVAQVIEIASTLAEVNLPLIALGDFNILENKPEYRILQGLSGLIDVPAQLDLRQDTRLSGNPFRMRRRRKRADERIDFVFTRQGLETDVVATRVRRIYDEVLTLNGQPASVSDHSGLIADLHLEVRPGLPHTPQSSAVDEARASLANGAVLAAERQRKQRGLAAGCAGAAVLLAVGAQRKPVSRRRFLRAGAIAAAGLSMTSAAMFAGLSQHFVPEEIQGFTKVGEILDALLRHGQELTPPGET